MKFSYGLSMIRPEFYLPLAIAAEEAGFDAVSLSDSIGYPERGENTYPYTADGSREFLENKPFLEPMIAAAAMSSVATRLVFRTGVLKLPIRQPVIFAKEVTSLAVHTGNRFVLGVGTSPWREDYDLVGLPAERRGARMEECIEIVRGLSAGGYFAFDGEFYKVPSVKLNPVPTEPIKIVVGGNGASNVERAARLGDGWFPNALSTDELAGAIDRLQRRRSELGRTGEFEVFASNSDSRSVDGVRRLADVGVTHTGGGHGSFQPYGLATDSESLQDKLDALRRYSDDVIAPLR